MKKRLVFTLILILAFFASSCASAAYERGQIRIEAAPIPGRPAPDFTISSPSLPGVEKLSDLRGKVVLVNFWATWCSFCRREMPALDNIYQNYKDQGFLVLGVDVGEDWDKVEAFRREIPFSFPITQDPDSEIYHSYWGIGIPLTLIVDRNGFVVFVNPGEITEGQINRILEGMGFSKP